MSSCKTARCNASRAAGQNCLAHADEEELSQAIEQCGLGAPLDGRGAVIDSDCMKRLRGALETDGNAESSTPLSPPVPAFRGEVRFQNATFTGTAAFDGVHFQGPAYFHGATFCETADFRRAKFQDHADFDKARFEGSPNFRGAVFDDHAGFERIEAAQVGAVFIAAEFRSYVDFENAVFASSLDLAGARFELARRLGPLRAAEVILEDSVFAERVAIDVIADRVSALSTTFADGVRLSIRGPAELLMEGTDFGRAATISLLPAEAANEMQARPRLLTLRGSQVASLTISGVNIETCRFFGAHGLESLLIESSCVWRHTPKSWRFVDRQILYEEQEWRVLDEQRRAPRKRYWDHGEGRGETGELLNPRQLAGLYRALRKAGEDNKDQPGTADLYYGEMEMRRKSPGVPDGSKPRHLVDRFIITAYWLISGYGLKASRALLAWLALVLGASLLVARYGYDPSLPLGRAVIFSIEGTSSFIRLAHPPSVFHIQPAGEAIRALLRILGPVLIGLWLLALRSRVKR